MKKKKNKRNWDRIIGIDLGNGLVKIRSVKKDGTIYTLTLPSGFVYASDIGENKINDKSYELDTFTISDVQYVWGKSVGTLDDIKSTYGHEGRYNSKPYRIMAKIVMARVVRDLEIEPNERIAIVTGVPSVESNTIREEEIREAFMGANDGLHEVGVNEEMHIFKVAHVEVQSQALATVIGRYLDEHGGVENEDYETMKVAVVDIGAGTTDIDLVRELQRLAGYDSIPKGFNDIYNAVKDHIKVRYPSHTANDYKLLEIIQEVTEAENKLPESKRGKAKYEYRPSVLKQPVAFTKVLRDKVEEIAVSIQQLILNRWADQTSLDEILLVGGSAELFKEYLDEIMDGVKIPVNNGDSNVEGYYRYGVAISNILPSEGDE